MAPWHPFVYIACLRRRPRVCVCECVCLFLESAAGVGDGLTIARLGVGDPDMREWTTFALSTKVLGLEAEQTAVPFWPNPAGGSLVRLSSMTTDRGQDKKYQFFSYVSPRVGQMPDQRAR